MREIMFAHSQKEQGVAKFEYNPADARWPSLFDLLRPLEDLEEMLLRDYAARSGFPFSLRPVSTHAPAP